MKWEVIEESLIQFMLNIVLLDDLEPKQSLSKTEKVMIHQVTKAKYKRWPEFLESFESP